MELVAEDITAVATEQVCRPSVGGKFVFLGSEKFFIKGVTYGAFEPDDEGKEYHDLGIIRHDFELMAENGINTVRIPHTTPPRALLDVAESCGLKVMVGLSAEQYVGHLIDRNKSIAEICRTIRNKVRAIAGHPALLCYAIGNEIPAGVVRWLGPRRIERYLKKIASTVRVEDPAGIVTYVNYPTTEFLDLSFLDVVCFNVYLESEADLKRYLKRLQNVAGDRPLIMSEIGLDAFRNGEEKQAEVIEWQIRTSFAGGCAGAIVFSWTDEWFRAGEFVHDWAFGLTDTYRRPKPALETVRSAFGQTPLSEADRHPRFSVIVCTFNGARTIAECLQHLQQLEYPDYEIIVVSDGSTDTTESIVRGYDVHLLCTQNRGLSHARNVGLQAATGEFIAYLDDDAYPDPHWLDYLAQSFLSSDHVAIGGPNVEPDRDGFVAECVANAPGGPIHVLLTDDLAEHIPGCNMAFRKAALENIGGFDPVFRVAGDDVDVCWRLQDSGWTLGFSPAAMVWHHRRSSVRGYLKQQRGYGRAEALLEAKWPQKYNSAGHHTFSGHIYGKGLNHVLGLGSRIYHGVWGTAPFQSLYQRSPGTLLSLPTMPEWYLLIAFLAGCSALAFSWRPLATAIPLVSCAIALSVIQACRGAGRASFPGRDRPSWYGFALCALTALLHLLQPLARMIGRVEYGLTLWRRRGLPGFALPRVRKSAVWTENSIAAETRLGDVERLLREEGAIVLSGDEYACWDLEVRGGLFGAARLLMAIEDHGAGCQYVRLRVWPRLRRSAEVGLVMMGALSVAATLDVGYIAAAVFECAFALIVFWTLVQCGSAMAAIMRATADVRPESRTVRDLLPAAAMLFRRIRIRTPEDEPAHSLPHEPQRPSR